LDYEWPGNVRELENIVERTLIQHRTGELSFSRFNLSSKDKGVPNIHERASLPPTLDQAMAGYIRNVLTLTQGKVNGPDGAAAILCINPNTLRNRMNRLGIAYGRNYRGMNR
jgi:DNA-binding NtrC family response regulator